MQGVVCTTLRDPNAPQKVPRDKTPLSLEYQLIIQKLIHDPQCPDFTHALLKQLSPSQLTHVTYSSCVHRYFQTQSILTIGAMFKTFFENYNPRIIQSIGNGNKYWIPNTLFQIGMSFTEVPHTVDNPDCTLGFIVSKDGTVSLSTLLFDATGGNGYYINAETVVQQTECPKNLAQRVFLETYDDYMVHIAPVINWLESRINVFLKQTYGNEWFEKRMTRYGVNVVD